MTMVSIPHILWPPINYFRSPLGNFSTKELARKRAQSLKEAKIIEDFYIVQPEDYPSPDKNNTVLII